MDYFDLTKGKKNPAPPLDRPVVKKMPDHLQTIGLKTPEMYKKAFLSIFGKKERKTTP